MFSLDDFVKCVDSNVEIRLNETALKDKKDFNLETLCFPQQLAFIRSKARYKIARCSRRAGKTYAIALYLIETCLSQKRANCLYISKTRGSAKDIIWKMLKEILYDNKIKVKTNETDLQILFHKTESTIKVFGADNLAESEKRRGQKLNLAIIDEAQLFPNYIKTLCDDILSVALSDTQGTLCLTGTPEPTCNSYFYHKDQEEGYEKHHWTWRENRFYLESAFAANPDIKIPDDILLADLASKNQSVEMPAVQREWFGQWVRSSDLLIYSYEPEKCQYVDLPQNLTSYVMGIDLGFADSDAIVILGWSQGGRECYVVEEFKRSKQTISELAVHIDLYIRKYRPIATVMDAGGLGMKIQEELNQRFSFAIIPAEKVRKFEFITLMNSELAQGYVKIRSDSQLSNEMKLLCKDEDAFLRGILKEDSRFDNHLTDACLYAWRYAYNYRYKEPPPKKTHEELIEEEIRLEKEKALNRFKTKSHYFEDPPRIRNDSHFGSKGW